MGRDKEGGQELVVPMPPGPGQLEENEGGDRDEQVHEPVQSKTPYAVFKKGFLGNYEPKDPPQSDKPGEIWLSCRNLFACCNSLIVS